MSAERIDVLAALRSCEDHDGHLNQSGRLIAHDLRKARELRGCGLNEAAAEHQASAIYVARNVLASVPKLRHRPRAALARVSGEGA